MTMPLKWEDVWQLLGLLFIVAALAVLFTALTADHRVNSYYVQKSNDGATCVRGSADWALDENAYCTDDINKALDALTRANAALATGSAR